MTSQVSIYDSSHVTHEREKACDNAAASTCATPKQALPIFSTMLHFVFHSRQLQHVFARGAQRIQSPDLQTMVAHSPTSERAKESLKTPKCKITRTGLATHNPREDR